MTNTEDYLSRSRLFRRLRSGAHGYLVELYAAHLVEVGLARHGTWRSLNVVGNLLAWMASHRTMLSKLDEHMVDRYLRHQGTKQTIQLDDRSALKRWLSILHSAGTIAPAAVPMNTPQEQIFAVWRLSAKRARSYCKDHRASSACDTSVPARSLGGRN